MPIISFNPQKLYLLSGVSSSLFIHMWNNEYWVKCFHILKLRHNSLYTARNKWQLSEYQNYLIILCFCFCASFLSVSFLSFFFFNWRHRIKKSPVGWKIYSIPLKKSWVLNSFPAQCHMKLALKKKTHKSICWYFAKGTLQSSHTWKAEGRWAMCLMLSPKCRCLEFLYVVKRKMHISSFFMVCTEMCLSVGAKELG